LEVGTRTELEFSFFFLASVGVGVGLVGKPGPGLAQSTNFIPLRL
jgi:hypothetical protein